MSEKHYAEINKEKQRIRKPHKLDGAINITVLLKQSQFYLRPFTESYIKPRRFMKLLYETNIFYRAYENNKFHNETETFHQNYTRNRDFYQTCVRYGDHLLDSSCTRQRRLIRNRDVLLESYTRQRPFVRFIHETETIYKLVFESLYQTHVRDRDHLPNSHTRQRSLTRIIQEPKMFCQSNVRNLNVLLESFTRPRPFTIVSRTRQRSFVRIIHQTETIY